MDAHEERELRLLALGSEHGGDVLGRDGALQLLAVEQLGLDLVRVRVGVRVRVRVMVSP